MAQWNSVETTQFAPEWPNDQTFNDLSIFKKYLKLQKTQDKIRKSQMVARVGKAAAD